MTSSDTHHPFSRACRRSHRPPTHLPSPRCGDGRRLRRQHQHGVAAIEFAFVLWFGLLPLLLLTFTGVMIFATKQSLELAAANGARAALQYQNNGDARLANATSVAYGSMKWLFNSYGQGKPTSPSSCTATPGAWICSEPCSSSAEGAPVTCIKVTTHYSDPEGRLFLFGAELLGPLQSSATIQLSPNS